MLNQLPIPETVCEGGKALTVPPKHGDPSSHPQKRNPYAPTPRAIRYLFEATGLGFDDLAKTLGCMPASAKAWFKGTRSPSNEMCEKIRAAWPDLLDRAERAADAFEYGRPMRPQQVERQALAVLRRNLSKYIPAQTQVTAATQVLDRLLGKPVQQNVNLNVSTNDFEALKAKCAEILAMRKGEMEARLVHAKEVRRAFESAREPASLRALPPTDGMDPRSPSGEARDVREPSGEDGAHGV